MKRIGFAVLAAAGVVAAALIVASAFAATDLLTARRTDDGYQIVEWNWTAAAEGSAQARTTNAVDGMLYRAFWEPCENTATMLAGGQAATITVTEYRTNGTWSDVGSDLAGGALTHNTDTLKTIAIWPTSVLPVTSPIQLDLSGATKTGGGGASGKLTLVISNHPSK
jgi:hypothetical protein